MTYDAVHSGELDIGRLFQRTFGMIGRNVVTLAVLGVVFVGAPDALLQFASSGLRSYAGASVQSVDWPLLLGAYLLYFCGIGLYNMASVRVAIDDAEGRRASIPDGLATMFRFLLPGLAAGAVLMVGAFATYLLFIIPGVIFLLTFFVVLPAIVAEKASVFGSFARSRELTRGRRGALFGAMFLLGIIVGIANFVVAFLAAMIARSINPSPQALYAAAGLATGLMSPIGAVFGAVVYQRLVELKEGRSKAKVADVFA
ncbi:MAG TPA: hypothetical protein VGL66_08405 [Caulobacteraceae bacterium]|jgi:hypothetical protein